MILNIMWKQLRFWHNVTDLHRPFTAFFIKKKTLIADTITGNPVVYIVGFKAKNLLRIPTETNGGNTQIKNVYRVWDSIFCIIWVDKVVFVFRVCKQRPSCLCYFYISKL